jgi:hypothetical protein
MQFCVEVGMYGVNMNEYLRFDSPDKATFGQVALAIPRCSFNCELGTLRGQNRGDQANIGTRYSCLQRSCSKHAFNWVFFIQDLVDRITFQQSSQLIALLNYPKLQPISRSSQCFRLTLLDNVDEHD